MHLDELMDYGPALQRLLSGMPADIKSKCVVKRFPAGSTVMKKEDVLEYVYLILKGELKVVNEFENGNIYAFASILPLSFVGELEVLSEELEYAVTIEAITECITIQIRSGDFEKWIQCDPAALLTVARGLAKKMYPTSYENGNVLFQPGIRKVQSYIAKYCNQRLKNEGALLVEKNRQQIADEVGISVKSVNRSVKKLKEEGFITVRKGKIYVSKNQYSRLLDAISEKE